jgi:chromosomal replication initiation ATPase DnaA
MPGACSRRIIEAAAAHFNVTVADVLGPSRLRRLVEARHVAMWLLREMRGFSLPRIAKYLHRGDHTTALHGIKHCEETPALKAAALEIMALLKEPTAEHITPAGEEAPDGQ